MSRTETVFSGESEVIRTKSSWEEMVRDLQVIMRHEVKDPERDLWLEQQAVMKIELFDNLPFITRYTDPPLFDRETLLRLALCDLKNPGYGYLAPRACKLNITTGSDHPRCEI